MDITAPPSLSITSLSCRCQLPRRLLRTYACNLQMTAPRSPSIATKTPPEVCLGSSLLAVSSVILAAYSVHLHPCFTSLFNCSSTSSFLILRLNPKKMSKSVAPQSSCPGSSRLPYTFVRLSVSNAIPTIREVPGSHAHVSRSSNSGCGTCEVVSFWPLEATVQRRPRKYTGLDPGPCPWPRGSITRHHWIPVASVRRDFEHTGGRPLRKREKSVLLDALDPQH